MDCKTRTGLVVRTTKLTEMNGNPIPTEYLKVRKEGITGVLYDQIFNLEIWLVKQEDGSIGAYKFEELEIVS